MGRGPGPGASLQSELAAARERAATALGFFAHVAPLAQRLGMTDFPEFSVFEGRFRQTDDLSTAQLRSDGVVVQQLHTAVASAVDVQKPQVGALAQAWPDGSGIAAQQQLRSMIPRAETDLVEIADIGAGMLVAADCIDVARLTHYECIAAIDPDNLVGVPITLWLKMKTACFSHHNELRAAITAAVELFGTAVRICDEAIEAILSELCTAMAVVSSADQPAAVSGIAGELGGAGGPADRVGGGNAPAEGVGGSGRDGVQADAGGGGQCLAQAGSAVAGPSGPGVTPVTASTLSGGHSGAPTVAGVSGVPGSPAVGAVALSGEAFAELLGPLAGVVGTVAAAAVTGLSEAITAALAQADGLSADGLIDSGPGQESAGSDGRSGSGSPAASITLGDKSIEIKPGPDGASVSLTVTGPGGDTDTQVLEVRPDGSIGISEATTGTAGAGVREGTGDQSGGTVEEAVTEGEAATGPSAPTSRSAPDTGQAPPAVAQTPCPAVESGSQTSVPQGSPQGAPLPVPNIEHTTPGVGDIAPNRDTPVSPQSSQQGDGAVPVEDGQLALAGDQ